MLAFRLLHGFLDTWLIGFSSVWNWCNKRSETGPKHVRNSTSEDIYIHTLSIYLSFLCIYPSNLYLGIDLFFNLFISLRCMLFQTAMPEFWMLLAFRTVSGPPCYRLACIFNASFRTDAMTFRTTMAAFSLCFDCSLSGPFENFRDRGGIVRLHFAR